MQDASGYVGRPLAIATQARLLEEFGDDRVLFKPEAAPLGPNLTALRDATGGRARVFEGSGGVALVDSYRRGIVGTMPGAELIEAIVALWNALVAGDQRRVDRLSPADFRPGRSAVRARWLPGRGKISAQEARRLPQHAGARPGGLSSGRSYAARGRSAVWRWCARRWKRAAGHPLSASMQAVHWPRAIYFKSGARSCSMRLRFDGWCIALHDWCPRDRSRNFVKFHLIAFVPSSPRFADFK